MKSLNNLFYHIIKCWLLCTVNIIAVITLCCVSLRGYSQVTVPYIKFEHIGTEEKPIWPLIISTKKVEIPLSYSEVEMLKQMGKKVIKDEDKALFQKNIITNQISYQLFKDYIFKHIGFFTKKQPVNLEYATFKVSVEQRVFYLNSVNSWQFFAQAIHYLQKLKSDKHLINGLNNTLHVTN
ncbi:hypothetical protein [Mucilaginibacter lacusdianchii]|uniref:hypothetical protein n=1 Tax=Mucilaginibacter lacusdianchii TaxID=2684211 RepID=UPI00131CEE79|nr:hypothetical protein [Mucilaginibacter sp. JXJ CY 39]